MSAIDTLRFALFGNPPVADYKPSRNGVLSAFSEMVASLNILGGGAIGSNITAVYAAKATLDSHLEFADRTLGLVYGDGNPALNGIYIKNGAINAGSWIATGLLGSGPQGVQGVQGPAVDTAVIEAFVSDAAISAADALVSANVANEAASVIPDQLASQAAFYNSRIADLQSQIIAIGGYDVAPYFGQVATRSYVSNFLAASSQAMCRTRHIAKDTITAVQVAYGAWRYQADTGDIVTAAMTVNVALEYPVGVIVGTFAWNGASNKLIPSGETALSDALACNVPSGAEFWLRLYVVMASGGVPQMGTGSGGNDQAYAGEAMNLGSSIADQTAGGTITNNNGGRNIYPLAVVGMTGKASFYLIGDSKTAGSGEEGAVGAGDTGELARSIGAAGYAYINAGVSSDFAVNRAHRSRRIAALAQYCSHVVVQLGFNDLFSGGYTAAQIMSNLNNIYSQYPSKPILQATITPTTTSTDAWATTGNQAVRPGEAERVTLNGLIRAKPIPLVGVLEIADVMETARNSGIFKAPGNTADGVHETRAGYDLIAVSGAINAAVLAKTSGASKLWTPWFLFDDPEGYAVWLDAANVWETSQATNWRPHNNIANFSQATGTNQPVLTASAINGRSAYLFDGVNDSFAGSATMRTLTNNANAATFAAVFVPQVQPSPTLGVIYADSLNGNANSVRASLYWDATTSKVVTAGRNKDSNAIIGAISSTTVGAGSIVLAMGEVNPSAGTLELRLNGTVDATATFSGTPAPFTNSDSNNSRVGGVGTVYPFAGYIGEIIRIPRGLTLDEKRLLEGYLAHKWGVNNQLISGHPYKNLPPQIS